MNSCAKELPAYRIAPELNRALETCGCAVVTAPPGAGKSTVLPLTILEGLKPGGRILMLEPRRIAARQIAERMASLLGGETGGTVGYRIRFESKVGRDTRIEVLTEGILTRMLAEDPTLDGVDVVIFDEFHERSINADVALALTREARASVREDLKIVIMSATIDSTVLCRELGAVEVRSEGRMFPVQTTYASVDPAPDCIASEVAGAVRKALQGRTGDILAFLPGEAEIRRCEELLQGCHADVLPLYGQLPFEQQRRALQHSENRKIVLATPIAETSLTIEGVHTVIDSGLCRKLVYNPASGLSRLETVRISADMADQRRGRAGRLSEGVCHRLWSQATQMRLAPERTPEIFEADLSPTVLDIASWGSSNPLGLKWLTPPPAENVVNAGRLLQMLGATDDKGVLTPHGRRLAALPCHPRIAGMLIKSARNGDTALAADIAAILEEKDPCCSDLTDICMRVDGLRSARRERNLQRAWGRIARAAAQYRRLTGARDEDNGPADPWKAGALLAAAYPERVAKLRPGGCGHYLMASSDAVAMDASDPMSSYEWLAVANVSVKRGGEGRIFLVAPVDPSDIRELIRERDNVFWDSKEGAVISRHEENIGCLQVRSTASGSIDREKATEIICEAARKEGMSMFDFNDDVANLQRRVAAVASWHPELELPDLSTQTVLEKASEWLPMFLSGASNARQMKKINLCSALWSLLDYKQKAEVERLAPTHIPLPCGKKARVEYRQGADAPILRARLEDCFGMARTPAVDDGRKRVLMELLSPGYKPVQLTSDLESFWKETYFEVRKELRRRYPKHPWPEDPCR